uniref:Linker for activation of T cells family member 2 n=1 Tax=Ictidomys tridecemlineatus TaxID=43179 RepID=A0A287CVD5_ICTTR
MSAGTELLWPGAALLLLLGTAAGLCVRCSRPGKGMGTVSMSQRPPRQENRQSFAVARTYSCESRGGGVLGWRLGVAWTHTPGPGQYLFAFCSGQAALARATDGDPIAADYYNWGCSTKSPEDDDDATSYENVLICKPRALESGEETEDYQNSASIHQWRESRRAVGHPCPAGSPEEDAGEPDYVNGDVTMAGEA